MRSFEQMANDDPEISHMMAYRQVRRFVRMMDVLRRCNTRKRIVIDFNVGSIGQVTEQELPRVKPCKEWEDCAEKK